MGIVSFDLSAPLDKAGMSIEELADRIDLGDDKLERVRSQKLSAVRLSTLAAICDALSCEPGDVLKYSK